MKNKKFIRLGSVLLFSATFATIPLIATSCAATVDAKQAFKNKIAGENINITSEAINVLGTDLYRQENGSNVLDVSHWKNLNQSYGLNEFNKPVNKVVFPIHKYTSTDIRQGAFYPKFEEIQNTKIEDIYLDFKLNGEVRFQAQDLVIAGHAIKNNAFLTKENKERLGSFPLQAFHNVTKIVFDLEDKDPLIYYASLPNAFRTYDESDPHLAEFQGKKYPGIVASNRMMFGTTLSSIIPFWEGSGEDQYLKRKKGVDELTSYPGFREFYWTLIGQEDMKIYIRSIPEFESILNLEYKQYAIDNSSDNIAQQNFTNMKILLDWNGESFQPDDSINNVWYNSFQNNQ